MIKTGEFDTLTIEQKKYVEKMLKSFVDAGL